MAAQNQTVAHSSSVYTERAIAEVSLGDGVDVGIQGTTFSGWGISGVRGGKTQSLGFVILGIGCVAGAEVVPRKMTILHSDLGKLEPDQSYAGSHGDIANAVYSAVGVCSWAICFRWSYIRRISSISCSVFLP